MDASADPPGPRWRRFGVTDRDAQRAVRKVWADFDDPRTVASTVEVSSNVSTNRVFLLRLSDGANVFAKVSNFGSPFLFREDHDRVSRLIGAFSGTRYENFLAAPLQSIRPTGSHRVHTYYDGSVWAVLYEAVERREHLPRILNDDDIECLAREMARFHIACADATSRASIPRTSTSIASDVVNLLDLASDRTASRTLQLDADSLGLLRKHANRFLLSLDDLGYADMARVPVFVDWNLGNFSVEPMGGTGADRFRLFSRWDYDWFRTDSVLLDFYFLSRVSSQTGDRTQFSYGVHTLGEPRFRRFLAAYHEVSPLTEADVEMIIETYRFFILHLVISVGDHFFRPDLWDTFRRDAIGNGLPSIDRFDRRPLLGVIR